MSRRAARGFARVAVAVLGLRTVTFVLAGCSVEGQTPDCSAPDAGCGFLLDGEVPEASVDATPEASSDVFVPIDVASVDAKTDGDAGKDGDADAHADAHDG